ncbi:fibronectin type III domain-containing protein [Catenuloplanes sp. NPDC051500]|uniref:fibronectin type III domain-containing protein n=1 Tax=Catenuloplanes sp. NPDC051500 TaxID=3363959 RepID=UPI0037A88DC7
MTVTPKQNSIWVTWNAIAGATVNHYVATATDVDGNTATCNVSTTSCLIGGLTELRNYSVDVAGYETAEASSRGTAANASSAAMPGPPVKPVLGVPAVTESGKVTLTWTSTPPLGAVSNGTASYAVTSSPSSAGCTTTGLSCTVEGLDPTKTYKFWVTAIGGGDTGSSSSTASSTVVPGVPSAPLDVVVSATSDTAGGPPGTHDATVMWMPATGGGPATDYTVTVAPKDLATPAVSYSCANVASVCNVTGFTDGAAYTVRVFANNAVGASAAATTSYWGGSPSMPMITSPPDLMTGTAILLKWTRPIYNQAAQKDDPTPKYTVEASPTVKSVTDSCVNITTLSCGVTGLEAGRSYKFKVKALGGSIAGAVTPTNYTDSYDIVGRPAAATGVKVEPVDTDTVKVSWTLPAGNQVPVGSLALYNSADGDISSFCNSGVPLGPTSTECEYDVPLPAGTRSFWVRTFSYDTDYFSDSEKVTAATGSPGIPYLAGATPAGPGAVKVSFRRPSALGAGIASYSVTSSPDNKMCTAAYMATDDVVSCTVNGLTAGTSYTFAIKSVGVAGNDDSKTVTSNAVVAGPPGPVQDAKAEAIDGGKVKVSWKAPASTALAITSYTVKSNPAGNSCEILASATPLECTFDSAATGTKYTIWANTAAAGSSEVTTDGVGVVPGTKPAIPADVSVMNVAQGLRVMWNGVAGATKYQAMAVAGGKSFWCAAIGAENKVCTIRGLTGGTQYTVTVRAVKDAINGDWSAGVTGTPDAALPTIVWPVTSPAGGGLSSSGGYNLYRTSWTTITGYGWKPGESVVVYFYSGTMKVRVGGATAKADGTFAAAIQIPANAPKGGSRALVGGWGTDNKVRWQNAYIKIW